jgi:hypothetical protein
MSDGVPQHFLGQGAWVSKDRKCRGLARLRVRGVGWRGKRRGSLGENVATRRISYERYERGQTSNGTLAYATLTAGNGDDLFHVRNATLGRKAATRHHRGFTLFR